MSGCATIEYAPAPAPSLPSRALSVPGIYHKVERKQTLWAISKLYGVELDAIINANNISDAAQIRAGQTIYIPRLQKKVPLRSAYSSSKQDFIWPVKGKVVSGFGEKTKNTVNKGMTFRLYSNRNVIASAQGAVVFINENLKGYGKTIIIAHRDGIMTVYAFLSRILVKPGDHISQGTLIAQCQDGVMYFEIRKGHISQNPYYYLPG
jgi:murein DD-endopeptidase MepM/ murein hydrolase activator NlpD